MTKTRTKASNTPTKLTAKRTIIFHDIEIVEDPLYTTHENYYQTNDFHKTLIKTLLNHLSTPIEERMMINNVKQLAFTDLSFNNITRSISGILILFKDDVNPEILKTSSGNIRTVDMDIDEGIIEKTHFVLHFTKNNKVVVAIEYNHSGPRVSDLMHCLSLIFAQQCLALSVKSIPIVREGLVERVKSLGNVTSMKFKVLNDYKFKLKESLGGVYSLLDKSEDLFKNQLLELVVRYDIKHYKQHSEVGKLVQKFVSFLKKDKTNYDVFDQLVISGEDLDNKGKKTEFDLLEFRLQFEITVEKDRKLKKIISSDIFSKIIELINTNLYGSNS